MKKKEKLNLIIRIGLIVIAIVYLVVLIKIVLFKPGTLSGGFRNLQYIPLAFVRDFVITQASPDVLLKNVLGNCAIFIPFGILVPTLFGKATLKETIFIGFCLSMTFEIIQYTTGIGVTDIDDLILNTLGTAIGSGIFFGIFRRCRNKIRTNIMAFIFLAAFGCCGVLALWLYHPSALPARIEILNQEILNGTDEDSYDISAKCIEIKDGAAHLEEDSIETGSKFQGTPLNQYDFSEDASIVIKHKVFQYSPNGNIQKQTIRYLAATQSEALNALKSDKHRFQDCLWLDNSGKCRLMIITLVD